MVAPKALHEIPRRAVCMTTVDLDGPAVLVALVQCRWAQSNPRLERGARKRAEHSFRCVHMSHEDRRSLCPCASRSAREANRRRRATDRCERTLRCARGARSSRCDRPPNVREQARDDRSRTARGRAAACRFVAAGLGAPRPRIYRTFFARKRSSCAAKFLPSRGAYGDGPPVWTPEPRN